MTKRFTPKASDYTQRMADLQRKKAKLVRELRALDAEETALKAFLIPFYEEGQTEVETADGELMVTYATTTRQYLDHDKAISIIVRAGKKVPYNPVDIVTFKVKAVKP